MFDKEKYLTRGIAETVPFEVQFLLWGMIEDARKQTALDYLQIFRLKIETVNNVLNQQILHKQEQPPYSASLTFPCTSPITDKIYVIDDGDYSTMLFASER